MFSEKSFTMTVYHTDDGYKAKVNNLDIIDPGKEGENPVRDFIEREYANESIERLQKEIENDFKIKFVDLFNWYWQL